MYYCSVNSSTVLCASKRARRLRGVAASREHVPQQGEPSLQVQPDLYGPQCQNCDGGPGNFTQGENAQTTQTVGSQQQTQVTQQIGGTLSALTGIALGSSKLTGSVSASWGVTNTMTWTDSQSVGTASGMGVSQSLTLNSGTQDCLETVPIFEDTVYHTFVFQELPGSGSQCSTLSPSFSVTTTPNNPSQLALSLGHSMSYTVDVSAWNGFDGTVALSANGLSAGVSASFSPASITTSSVGSATLTLTAAYSNSTYIGNSTITVTGTSGSVSNSSLIQLTTRPLQYAGYCGVQ